VRSFFCENFSFFTSSTDSFFAARLEVCKTDEKPSRVLLCGVLRLNYGVVEVLEVVYNETSDKRGSDRLI